MHRDPISLGGRGEWRVPVANLGDMPSRRVTIGSATPVLEVERMFVNDATLSSMVVPIDGEAVCMTRAWFFAQIIGPLGYGRSLYVRHRVDRLPRPQTLVLPAPTTLVGAARELVTRPEDRRYDDVVVAYDDGAFGTICVADLFAELAHTHAYVGLHDPLTGLPNRRLFLDRLRRAQAAAANGVGGMFAVLFVDVDEFKPINDVLGHEAGDRALEIVAARLAGVDAAQTMVARLGGDEFGVLIEQARGSAEVLQVVEQISAALSGSVVIGDDRVALSASTGVVLGSESSSAEDLLRNADLAMYAAKRRRKGSYAFYEDGMHTKARYRLELRTQLEGALERREFELAYQPVVELEGLSIVAAEALVRWVRPDYGHVGPGEFIPLAEQTGMIVQLGAWVLEEACGQAMAWSKQEVAEVPFELSVNVSPRQLHERGFVEAVSGILSRTGMRPESLVLEITENVFIDDTQSLLDRLAALKRLGVRLALDDFGAGFSSLGYLSRMPIDILKLDRAFVAQLGDTHERGLLGGIVALARSLDLVTVAEGVETEEQIHELRAAGCDRGQGYYFARPMSRDAWVGLFGSAHVAPTLPVSPLRVVEPEAA